MMARVILYEYPFNERIRTYLRLEHLFRRLGELVPRAHAIDHHYALAKIFEVMDVAARADLKADVMKDLDRQRTALAGYRGNPAVSQAVLDDAIGKLDRLFNSLNTIPGKAGTALGENEWLMSIAAASTSPAARASSTCPRTTHGSSGPPTAAALTSNGGPRRSARSPNRCTCCSSSCANPARRRR